MNKDTLRYILKEAHALILNNPFGDERKARETKMLATLGEAPGSKVRIKTPFRRLLPWFKLTEEALLKYDERKLLSGFPDEQISSFVFFMLYHDIAGDLDKLIRNGTKNNPLTQSLYNYINRSIGLRHRLIERIPDRIWNRPDHLFACFYQLRRAFFNIQHGIVGESAPIRNLRKQVWESVFTKDMMSYQRWMYETVGSFPTLILGPSGSGKEIVARAIGLSRFLPYDTKTGNFVAEANASFHPVNLSALSETLIESELFGHRKGAFTGAVDDRAGLFATAGKYGVVFLDEIGDVSEPIQVKLLRLLQSGEFQAIGDDRLAYYKGKIIAATHRNLAAEMHSERFREDFYYRLCGDQVHTVALRDILNDRPEELIASVNFICTKLFGNEGAETLAPGILETLKRDVSATYTWPGNFRELEQAIRNIIVRNKYNPVNKPLSENIAKIYENTNMSLAQWNCLYARKAFENTGSYSKAARKLGIDQRTLKKWVVETLKE